MHVCAVVTRVVFVFVNKFSEVQPGYVHLTIQCKAAAQVKSDMSSQINLAVDVTNGLALIKWVGVHREKAECLFPLCKHYSFPQPLRRLDHMVAKECLYVVLAEASCLNSLQTAKAVVAEAGTAVAPGLHQLAKRSEKNSETAIHKTFAEFGLALDVPLTKVEAGSKNVECILMSDWLRVLLKPS